MRVIAASFQDFGRSLWSMICFNRFKRQVSRIWFLLLKLRFERTNRTSEYNLSVSFSESRDTREGMICAIQSFSSSYWLKIDKMWSAFFKIWLSINDWEFSKMFSIKEVKESSCMRLFPKNRSSAAIVPRVLRVNFKIHGSTSVSMPINFRQIDQISRRLFSERNFGQVEIPSIRSIISSLASLSEASSANAKSWNMISF